MRTNIRVRIITRSKLEVLKCNISYSRRTLLKPSLPARAAAFSTQCISSAALFQTSSADTTFANGGHFTTPLHQSDAYVTGASITPWRGRGTSSRCGTSRTSSNPSLQSLSLSTSSLNPRSLWESQPGPLNSSANTLQFSKNFSLVALISTPTSNSPPRFSTSIRKSCCFTRVSATDKMWRTGF